MKFLFLSNVLPTPAHPHRGAFNAELIRALRHRGHDVNLIVPVSWLERIGRRRADARQSDSQAYYPTFWYPPRWFRSSYHRWMRWSIHRSVQRAIGNQRPDAVVAFWVHPDGTCAVEIAHHLGVPAVVIAGGSDLLVITKDKKRAQVIRQTLAKAGAVLAEGSHLVAKALELGAPTDRTYLFRRGVDSRRFSPGSQRASRERLGLPIDQQVLLWAGNIVAIKGLDTLLAAYSRLTEPRPLLVLIGDGPLRVPLENQVRLLGIMTVRFVGRVAHQELGDWYQASDVFVLPSRSEGTPNVLQEATACGVPFVASDVGAVGALASSADRVVQPGDDLGFSTAIKEILAAPGERHGKAPFAASWDAAVDQIELALRNAVPRG